MRLADPIALALLAAIPVLLFLRGRLSRGGAGAYSDLGLLAGMRPTWRVRFRWLPTAFSALALALLVFALARPQRGQAETQLPGQGIDIVLVLDSSSSMSASMGRGSRAEVTQKVIQDFVKGRKEDRVGLVIFRETSLVLSPMTLDYEALGELVTRVNDVNLPDGTAIGVGLSEALNVLRDSRARSRVVILLTDGENNSGNIEPLTAARLAETLGIRVYTIGAVDSRTRRGGQANVDEKALTEMARLTGGHYYAADSEETLDEVYKSIEKLEKSRVGRTQYGAYDEYAVYLLVAALAMLGIELALRSTLWRQST
jgi:Ca-activated chloride channel family protein